jgi:hypothetical protein
LRLHSIITLVEKVFLAALRLVSRSAQQLFWGSRGKVIDFPKLSYWHQQQNFARGVDSSFEEEYGIQYKKLFSEQEEWVIYVLFLSHRVLLSLDIDEQQKLFILAKEIAYNYLKLRIVCLLLVDKIW